VRGRWQIQRQGEDQPGLLLAGSGTSWTPTEAPLPGDMFKGRTGLLASVACPSTSQCIAVGHYFATSAYLQEGLIVTGSALPGPPAQAPLPGNASSDPSADIQFITCYSATSCVAIGDYYDKSNKEHGLILTGSGSSWAGTEAPLPANAAPAPPLSPFDLSSAACISATSCAIVGD
jgi:hypothetical protein